MYSPRTAHTDALHHVLSYVLHTPGQGIVLKGAPTLKLQAFSDSDWASCPDSKISLSGYLLMSGDSPISWKSKKQAIVSRSSLEAEYMAMASAATEITWLVRELHVLDLTPFILQCVNQSALHIAQNPVFHERTKHIDLDCHFTRENVMEGLVELTYLPTKQQLAGVFTKVLISSQFQLLLNKHGMIYNPASLEGEG